MRIDDRGKRFLEPIEGRRIDLAASKRGMRKGEFAEKVSPGRADARHHLRNIFLGREAFGDDWVARVATALGCSIEDLFRIISGFDDFDKFPSFSIIEAVVSSPNWKADRFYNGSRPSMEDLAANFDITRWAYKTPNGIQSRLKSLLSTSTRLQTLAIIGAGGTGKSTLLRRAAFEAAKDGNLVLMLNSEWDNREESVVRQLRRACDSTTAPVVVAIDDISDHLSDGSVFPKILAELENLRIVLLVTEHPDRWQSVLKKVSSLVPGKDCWVHSLHQLSESECELLVDRILMYESDGTVQVFCSLSRDERLAFCKGPADRHLVVIMLQLRHGLPFERIIQNEYERIQSEKGKEGYALVCYFETLRLYLPPVLLLRVLNILMAVETQEFYESTDGLLEDEDGYVVSRNRFIARVITKYALAKPAAKKTALLNVLSQIEISDEMEKNIFFRAFTGEGTHKGFVTDMARDSAFVQSFYDSLIATLGRKFPTIKKFILSSFGLAQRILQNTKAARLCFEEAIGIDPSYEFAYRQLAWLEFSEKKWDAAARNARKAVELEPNNFKAAYDAARIHTWSVERWFPAARQYWQRAIDLDPGNERLIDQWETYQAYDEQRTYLMRGLKDDDLIPERVWKELRPGLLFDKLRFGTKDPRVLQKLKHELTLMQQDTQGSLDGLAEKLAGFEVGADSVLKALQLANIARVQFVTWRRGESLLSLEELETIFRDAIRLNPSDPFAHCWYGTFLKETRRDFGSAEGEYRKAIDLSNSPANRRFREHPLFLNNLALLVIDEVQLGRRKSAELQEAKKLLKRAIARVPETKPDFFWPEYNLSWCERVMEDYQVSSK